MGVKLATHVWNGDLSLISARYSIRIPKFQSVQKKKVILSVTNDLVIDQRVHRAASSLVEAGFSVCVVGRRLPESLALDRRPYQTHRMRLIFRQGKLFYVEFAFRLFWFLLLRKVDILHANDLDTLLPNFLVSRIRRKRLVYDSHEYFTEVPELVNRPGTQKVWLKLEQWIFPKLRYAMTVNTSIAEIYADKYKVSVGVVRNVPLAKPFPSPQEKIPKRLIYQGALNLGRGIEKMIEAMRDLQEYHLEIFGKGDEEEMLKRWAAECEVLDRVSFKGAVPFGVLASHTQQAVLGFSLEEAMGENYRLALPNKIFDYIQAGVPSLVSDLPEIRRIVAGYGVGEVLPDAERTGAIIAQKVRAICDQPENWQKYFSQCQKAAAELVWENEREKLLSFYQ